MRTNIILDDNLVQEAFKYCSVNTKKELIHLALQEFVEKRRRLNLLDLEGKFEFAADYDHKKLRERQ
jgi:Arc/MetJ family transcription regulator